MINLAPELDFKIESVDVLDYAAVPTLEIRLGIEAQHSRHSITDEACEVHSIQLLSQLQIESTRRSYTDQEQERLYELYGDAREWGRTLRNLHWTQVSVAVPSFTDRTSVPMHVPCSFDFNAATTKYFDALENGEIPICILFSGSIFYETPKRTLQVGQVSWNHEVNFRLSVEVWKKMMALYYPNTAWLTLQKDVYNRLSFYKIRSKSPTWEQALEKLLDQYDNQCEGVLLE